MSESWYFVEKGNRLGPVSLDELIQKVKTKSLNESDFVWRKGFDNWRKIKDCSELTDALHATPEIPEIPELVFDMAQINLDEKLFLVKIGPDRGGQNEKEYGPYSLNMLKTLHKDNRVNGKTLVFAPGMNEWRFLGELDRYQEIFQDTPPSIPESDKRMYKRKPCKARMFFSDNKKVFEGVCRDVSIGGMQVLIADFPGKVGDKIALNVELSDDSGDAKFVANGKVVRVLESQGGFSLRFTELNHDAMKAIQRYIGE
jgi:hypothetical protein